jgi:pimeloyl-ACP methyl ester carboxylesterase
VGVLLCYPGVQEYMYSHWAYRNLAAQLARAGFHVLRFDYYATGDSAGDARELTLAQGQEDIATAAQELKDVAGVGRVSAIGMRLGAALLALASSRGLGLEDVVLWDPVVRGAGYVEELTRLEAQQRRSWRQPAPVDPEVLLGYPFPRALRAELEALDLLALRTLGARRAVLVLTEERPEYAALAGHLERSGAVVETQRISAPPGSSPTEGALLSDRALQSMTAVLTRRAA